jgi:hypothetical protein
MKNPRSQHLSIFTFFEKVNVKLRSREKNAPKMQKILPAREKKVSVK